MLSLVTALALLPAAPAPADEYEFLLDTGRFVIMSRPGGLWGSYIWGWLDDAGNFVPTGEKRTIAAPAGPPLSLWMKGGAGFSSPALPAAGLGRSDRSVAYEYRSGVLIKGQFDETWKFVPEVGSMVISLRDYLKDYDGGTTRAVYNLPGLFYRKGTPVPLTEVQKGKRLMEQSYLKMMADRGIANPPADDLRAFQYYPGFWPTFLNNPPVAGRAAAPPAPPAPIPPGVYEFVPDTERPVELRRRYGADELWYIGRLDAAGHFEFDRNYLHAIGPKPAGAPAAVLLNREGLGAVYEYRSGALVKGRIDGRLNFVPEVGSKVVSFHDYSYGTKDSRFAPDPLPIWNLPGTFRKKEPDKK